MVMQSKSLQGEKHGSYVCIVDVVGVGKEAFSLDLAALGGIVQGTDSPNSLENEITNRRNSWQHHFDPDCKEAHTSVDPSRAGHACKQATGLIPLESIERVQNRGLPTGQVNSPTYVTHQGKNGRRTPFVCPGKEDRYKTYMNRVIRFANTKSSYCIKDDVTRDNVTSTVISIDELMEQSECYIDEGMHPRAGVNGLESTKEQFCISLKYSGSLLWWVMGLTKGVLKMFIIDSMHESLTQAEGELSPLKRIGSNVSELVMSAPRGKTYVVLHDGRMELITPQYHAETEIGSSISQNHSLAPRLPEITVWPLLAPRLPEIIV
ncbi:hypothetical protein VNO77_30878 [Canavalia gladiata]|uniref:Uncharacterized protein n=1 Tax=Canavalia gladiata TaxID=3824 RepID=A0AAN9KP86_CANGL